MTFVLVVAANNRNWPALLTPSTFHWTVDCEVGGTVA